MEREKPGWNFKEVKVAFSKREKNFNTPSDEQEKVIQIRRVTKVVKGGKNMSFRATVIVGDLKGKVGLGIGKSTEVPKAIRKGIEKAKKRMINFNLVGTSIAHQIVGKFGASQVLLQPAKKGTGVIAGGAVRSVLELSGIKDIVAKSMGSNNAINSALATLDGLDKLMDREKTEETRGLGLFLRNVSEGTIEGPKPLKEESDKTESKDVENVTEDKKVKENVNG